MNLVKSLLGSQSGALVNSIAKAAGVDPKDAENVIGKLLPALSKGVKNNTTDQDGLDNLLNALNKGDHQRYIDDPDSLQGTDSTDEGNSILGHIFGSKDVSRNVAAHTAKETGISSGIIKKMLPLVAAVAMGALSKKSAGAGLLGTALAGGAGSKAMGMLTSFLDADDDGHVIDDVLRLAKKLF